VTAESGNSARVVVIEQLQVFTRFIARQPVAAIVAVLVAVSLVKSGFVVWNWFELSPQLLTNWGHPDNSFQSNVLFNAFGTLWSSVGLDTTSMLWLVTQVVITIGVFAALAVLVLRRTKAESSYLALAVILSSGISAVLWREMGRYDALFILGIALAMLASKPWLSWVGAVIAALTSPEQALIAGGLALLIVVAPVFREWSAIAVRLLVASASVVILIQIWFSLAGDAYKTRIGILLPFISGEKIEGATAYDPSQGFIRFTFEKAMVTAQAGPSLVWSYLGVATVLLVLCLILQRSWLMAAYLLAIVILVPLVVSTMFGEDRTRDLVMIAAPGIIMIAILGSRVFGQLAAGLPGGSAVWLTWAAVIVTMIPLTYFYLHAEEPFHWAKELLISINNGVEFAQDGSPR